jgi:hypothetical protein
MIDNRVRNKQNCNGEARPNRLEAVMRKFNLKDLEVRTPIDPIPKDKAKRVVE